MISGSRPDAARGTDRSVRDGAGLRATTVILVTAVLAVGAPLPAVAHSQLVNSDPPAGASLERAPDAVSLVFSEDVEPQFAAVTVAVGGGDPVEAPSRVQASEVVADVPLGVVAATTAGERTGWQVAYRVVSGDGHPVTGTVDFTVATAAPATTAPTPSTASTATPPQPARDTSTEAPESALAAEADQDGGWSIGRVLGVAAAALAVGAVGVLLVSRRRNRSS